MVEEVEVDQAKTMNKMTELNYLRAKSKRELIYYAINHVRSREQGE